ncbi:MAG: glycosyl hydrolase [Pelobium sp.]
MSKIRILVLVLLNILTVDLYAQMVDRKASFGTRNLFHNLLKIDSKGVLFGHQDDMAYGIGWQYQQGRSDIKELTGEYPAVLGWDLAGLENNREKNIDGVPFEQMGEYIRSAYNLGLVNTISWHMDNPLNGNTAWDTTSVTTVKEMLPGGKVHEKYKQWLDKFVKFNETLVGDDGKLIPILFRPFHEHSGSWFWWGKKECTPTDYKELWKFTVKYLRKVKKLHNLIYVFNPNDFTSETEYLERYPGDDYVDVLSFDTYQTGPVSNGEAFKSRLAAKLVIQDNLAKKHNKISAIAEIGYVEIPDPNWWSEVLWKGIEQHPPAFIMAWRNAGFRELEKDNHYYAPHLGHPSSVDFMKMMEEKKILFQGAAKSLDLYANPKP